MSHLGYFDDDRCHQQYSCDIVKECGNDSCDKAQHEYEDPLSTPSHFATVDGTEVKEATLCEDGHHQHHPE